MTNLSPTNRSGAVSPAIAGTYLGNVGYDGDLATVEITLPAGAPAYTVNQRVGPSAASDDPIEITGIARAVGGFTLITGFRLDTDLKSITPRWQLHLYNVATPTLAVDNANWLELYADTAKRVAYWPMPALSTPLDAANSTTSRAQDYTPRILAKCSAVSTSLWIAIQTLDAFSRAAGQKITVTIKGIRL